MNVERIDHDVDIVGPQRTIVTALPLERAARQRLAELLDARVLDIELTGPVKRVLRSGAAAYLLADSIDELAAKIASRPNTEPRDTDPPAVHELTASATVDDLVAAFLRESVEYAARHRATDS